MQGVWEQLEWEISTAAAAHQRLGLGPITRNKWLLVSYLVHDEGAMEKVFANALEDSTTVWNTGSSNVAYIATPQISTLSTQY